MSDYSQSTTRGAVRLPKLTSAADFSGWIENLQDYMFMTCKSVNMHEISQGATLDVAHFIKDADFKDEIKEATKKAKDDESDLDVFDFDKDLAGKCFNKAIKTGLGFKQWVHTLHFEIRMALSDQIRKQTLSVRRGDLLGLLSIIRLAMQQTERYDPDELELAYYACTMEQEGENDLGIYLGQLAVFVQRLEAVGWAPNDKKQRKVCLKGLNQDIFESFINDAERTPYGSYFLLKVALETRALKPRMAALLKPGAAQSMLTTRTSTSAATQGDPPKAWMERIETVLTTLTSHNRSTADQDLLQLA